MGWTVATAIMAAVAAVTNTVVAVHLWRAEPVGTNQWAIWHTVTAAAAAFYAFMFADLALDPGVDRAAWSERLTPASAVSFLTIWTVPAVIHLVTRPGR